VGFAFAIVFVWVKKKSLIPAMQARGPEVDGHRQIALGKGVAAAPALKHAADIVDVEGVGILKPHEFVRVKKGIFSFKKSFVPRCTPLRLVVKRDVRPDLCANCIRDSGAVAELVKRTGTNAWREFVGVALVDSEKFCMPCGVLFEPVFFDDSEQAFELFAIHDHALAL
jgi:hypothetical protein